MNGQVPVANIVGSAVNQLANSSGKAGFCGFGDFRFHEPRISSQLKVTMSPRQSDV